MSTIVDHSSVTSYGPSRSVVRMLATRLPIDTGQRIYIQLPHVSGSHPPSPSASHTNVFDLTSLIKEPSLFLGKQFSMESIHEEGEEPPTGTGGRGTGPLTGGAMMSQESRVSATKRITSLEAELARLKAQIATYAMNEVENMESNQTTGTAPPPPPPPPPPPLTTITNNTIVPSSSAAVAEATPSRPPMSSVLKDIGSVKLRTVGMERSPGGTPLKPKRLSSQSSLDPPSMDDPASIIAHALRKKFSHRIFQDSPDKENLDRSECSFSEFDSPVSGTSTSKTLQFESPAQNNY